MNLRIQARIGSRKLRSNNFQTIGPLPAQGFGVPARHKNMEQVEADWEHEQTDYRCYLLRVGAVTANQFRTAMMPA